MAQIIDNVINYAHLLTTRPHDIRRVVISDLHLSVNEPALVQAFLALLNDLLALPDLKALYILGDWFDAWVGDDVYLTLSKKEKQQHWLTPLIDKLKQLSTQGCQIFVMHGNRDCLIGQAFCNSFNGQLIDEPHPLIIGTQKFRLEHGDALCTDDVTYQRFRKVMRNPIVQWLLLKRPLEKRLALAKKIRQKSAAGKMKKPQMIMDVNESAVITAIQNADVLLHGHTHLPDIHQLANHKIRYVLGDWRVLNIGSSRQHVTAVIGVTTVESNDMVNLFESFYLVNFEY